MNKEFVDNKKDYRNLSKVRHYITLFTVLFVFWILLSGKLEAKFIIVGFLTSLVATWITGNLLRLPATDGRGFFYAFDFPYFKYAAFWGWLLVQVVKSNITLAKIILSPNMKINPQVITFKKTMNNPIAHVTLGNSITLTPGTVTMDIIGEDTYVVHALTDKSALDLVPREGEGVMPAMVSRVFGEETLGQRGGLRG